MPKLKTNRSVAKRFRLTKSGKIKKRNAGRGHVLGKKTRKLKRQLRRSGYLSPSDAKRVRRLLPYGTS
ncbi:MAG: 50S ribosomal protein L35 [Candidatus Omnitrophica bacterium]|nr:50S ribosomal protein L35 [Candidatus Omnitrophota bacterium]